MQVGAASADGDSGKRRHGDNEVAVVMRKQWGGASWMMVVVVDEEFDGLINTQIKHRQMLTFNLPMLDLGIEDSVPLNSGCIPLDS